MNTEEKDKKDPCTCEIIGAAMEVHWQLGHGFLEPVYQEAMAIELRKRNIPFQRERPLAIQYKGETLDTQYRADFIGYESIIVELKALSTLSGTEESQVLNYLKATRLRKALLLNFDKPRLEY